MGRLHMNVNKNDHSFYSRSSRDSFSSQSSTSESEIHPKTSITFVFQNGKKTINSDSSTLKSLSIMKKLGKEILTDVERKNEENVNYRKSHYNKSALDVIGYLDNLYSSKSPPTKFFMRLFGFDKIREKYQRIAELTTEFIRRDNSNSETEERSSQAETEETSQIDQTVAEISLDDESSQTETEESSQTDQTVAELSLDDESSEESSSTESRSESSTTESSEESSTIESESGTSTNFEDLDVFTDEEYEDFNKKEKKDYGERDHVIAHDPKTKSKKDFKKDGDYDYDEVKDFMSISADEYIPDDEELFENTISETIDTSDEESYESDLDNKKKEPVEIKRRGKPPISADTSSNRKMGNDGKLYDPDEEAKKARAADRAIKILSEIDFTHNQKKNKEPMP